MLNYVDNKKSPAVAGLFGRTRFAIPQLRCPDIA